MFLNDQETETDLLYHEAVAQTIVKLITSTTEAPITVGVHGDWGAGKSSVLKMISRQLASNKDVLCLWFNGWTFEGFDDAKAVVIETVVDELRKARPESQKVLEAARKVLRRVNWLKVAKTAGSFAFTAATGLPSLDHIGGLYDLARNVLEKSSKDLTPEDLKGAVEKAEGFIKDAPEEPDTLPQQIHAFRKEFKELIDAANVKQLVVIVDDLDRCLPATAIATLEAIRLFLFVEKTAFVIGADELMIEYAVGEHFPALPPSSGSTSYARNYLEKLIQVPFRIPALGAAETRMYMYLLLVENALGRTSPVFAKLLTAAREDLKRPWLGRGPELASIKAALAPADPPADVMAAALLAEQVTRVLSDGTRGNPRQIKRFLNTMMLRQAIAAERGFGDVILRPVLAKVMLAERFFPDFYEQLARLASGAPDGKPSELSELEQAVRAPGPAAPAGKPGAKVSGDPFAGLEEWLKSEWAKNWAALDPKVSDVDLRPYVFVTRDKRSYLGAFVAAGHLEALVERLMGPQIMVVRLKAEIRALPAPDAEEIFVSLRGRILQGDQFAKEPPGFAGLVELVKAHTALEVRLVDLLRELPVPKIGAWVVTRLAGIKGDAAKAPAMHLLKTLAASDNATVKAAAEAVQNLEKK